MCDERGKETNSPYGMDKEDRRSWQGDMCVMYQDHCYCHKFYCSYCCISFVDFLEICFFSSFITHSTLIYNQWHLNLLLMHFSSYFRCRSIFSVPLSRILSIATKMQMLLHLYISTLCIVH
jgi:hypothetical protein